MELYSTKHQVENVNLEEAVFKGLPDDNGLYLPTHIPQLPDSFFENIGSYSLQKIAFEVCKALFDGEIGDEDIKSICDDAINFEAPVVHVKDNLHCLELFHGPSLAFKDFGARFMARLMSHFLKGKDAEINILVATSGDTGSAVAQGFLGAPGIKVTILYPSGKVSLNQEKQLTTLGRNITALEVDGVFDDCQRLVKSAFLDKDLTSKLNLSSANSINIARLIPQSLYYFYAYAQLAKLGKSVVFCVPSGNFGNLCGGLIAQKMGLPIAKFIAATNVNDVVPQYLSSGNFEPRASVATLSNAMDVGNPSNFQRLEDFFGKDHALVTGSIAGATYNDSETKDGIKEVYDETGYVMCPHTSLAYLGLRDYIAKSGEDVTGVFLSTAHPAKFNETVEGVIGKPIEMPSKLQDIIDRPKVSIEMGASFDGFKDWLLTNG